MQESVQQFLREFNRVKKDYRFIDLNIVAVRWTNYWLNICTRVTLLTDRTQRRKINVPKDLPDNLKIVSAVLPIDDLEIILIIFESGFYNFEGEIIGYNRLDPSSKPTIPVYPYFSINKRDSSKQILPKFDS